MSDELYLHDVGTYFEVAISENHAPVDISAAVGKVITFLPPDKRMQENVALVRNAEFKTNGTDGLLVYVFVANDLHESGTWKYQVFLQLPTGSWHSTIGTFEVKQNL